MDIACNVMFTQMTAKAGIKQFGETAVAAMLKEFKQLDEGAKPGNPVVIPTDANTLSIEEKRKALRAINLIKEKRKGTLKGRTCDDGSSQRQYLKQDESVASPTVSLESILTTLLVDVHEGRQVAIFDVPEACLQAYLNVGDDKERVILKLAGDFVDIM